MKMMRRPQDIYGRKGPIPVGKTKFWDDYVFHEGGDEFIPGTQVPRLRLAHLGVRAVAAFDDEVDAVVEGLRRERDAKLAEPVKTKQKTRR